MKKKKVKGFRLIFSGLLASVLCLFLARHFMIFFWKFNIFSPKQWQVIATYWNSYGVISKGIDYLFFFTLFAVCLSQIFLWIFFYHMDFRGLLNKPLIYLMNHELRKYENQNTHIKLKNMAPTEKKTLEEFIDERLSAQGVKKRTKGVLVQSLREKIKKKFLHREG